MNNALLESQLILHEELRLFPYRCTKGKLTIGVGRNLDDRGLTRYEAMFLLRNDIERVIEELNRMLPWWTELDEVRQRVLADLCFNLGLAKLLMFRRMLAGLKAHDFTTAADELENSDWFFQTGKRGRRLVRMMETGRDGERP